MTIRVYGIPAPQGSKRYVGRGISIESSTALKPWREAVKAAAIENGGRFEGTDALRFSATFLFRRPKSVSEKKRPHHTVTPDLDKLVRATMDALTQSGTWGDDAQVSELEHVSKRYCGPNERPGAFIVIEALA